MAHTHLLDTHLVEETPDRAMVLRAVYSPGALIPRLSPYHLALMNRLRVDWLPIENGTLSIDCQRPLLGDGSPTELAMSVLGTDNPAVAIRTLGEVGLLISGFVGGRGVLGPGRYTVPQEMREFFNTPNSGVDSSGHFKLRHEHLTLLKTVFWEEVDGDTIEEVLEGDTELWPMPYANAQYPYGIHSNSYSEMAELLNMPYRRDENGELVDDPNKDEMLQRLHLEMAAALQVFLAHATVVMY